MKRMKVSQSVIEGSFGDDPKLDWTSISQFEGKVQQVPIGKSARRKG